MFKVKSKATCLNNSGNFMAKFKLHKTQTCVVLNWINNRATTKTSITNLHKFHLTSKYLYYWLTEDTGIYWQIASLSC